MGGPLPQARRFVEHQVEDGRVEQDHPRIRKPLEPRLIRPGARDGAHPAVAVAPAVLRNHRPSAAPRGSELLECVRGRAFELADVLDQPVRPIPVEVSVLTRAK